MKFVFRIILSLFNRTKQDISLDIMEYNIFFFYTYNNVLNLLFVMMMGVGLLW